MAQRGLQASAGCPEVMLTGRGQAVGSTAHRRGRAAGAPGAAATGRRRSRLLQEAALCGLC